MKLGSALMALARRQSPALLAASAVGWIAVAVIDRSLMDSALCGPGAVAADRMTATLALNPLGPTMLAWVAMLLAMMPPLLNQPIAHLRRRSLARRRWRAVVVFAASYTLVWLGAGIGLIGLALALTALRPASGLPTWPIAALIALIWQLAPVRQDCLNRCHRLIRLSPFGAQADIDCARYGATHGFWCVGSCWALMLLPLTAGRMHLLMMAAVTLALLIERAQSPRPARWAGLRRTWPPAPAVLHWPRLALSAPARRGTEPATPSPS